LGHFTTKQAKFELEMEVENRRRELEGDDGNGSNNDDDDYYDNYDDDNNNNSGRSLFNSTATTTSPSHNNHKHSHQYQSKQDQASASSSSSSNNLTNGKSLEENIAILPSLWSPPTIANGDQYPRPAVITIDGNSFGTSTSLAFQLSNRYNYMRSKYLQSEQDVSPTGSLTKTVATFHVKLNDLQSLNAAIKAIARGGYMPIAVFLDGVTAGDDVTNSPNRLFYGTMRHAANHFDCPLIFDSTLTNFTSTGYLSIVDNPNFASLQPPDVEIFGNAITNGEFPAALVGFRSKITTDAVDEAEIDMANDAHRYQHGKRLDGGDFPSSSSQHTNTNTSTNSDDTDQTPLDHPSLTRLDQEQGRIIQFERNLDKAFVVLHKRRRRSLKRNLIEKVMKDIKDKAAGRQVNPRRARFQTQVDAMSDYEDEELTLDGIDLTQPDLQPLPGTTGTKNPYYPQPFPNFTDLVPFLNRTGYYHDTILSSDGLHNSPFVAAAVTHTLDLMSKPNPNIKQFMPHYQHRRRGVMRSYIDRAEVAQRTWDHTTLHQHATAANYNDDTPTTLPTTKNKGKGKNNNDNVIINPESLEQLYSDIVSTNTTAPLHKWSRAMSRYTNTALTALRDRYPHLINRIATNGSRHTIVFKPSMKFPIQTGNGNLWGVEGKLFKQGLQVEATGFGQPSIILNFSANVNFSEVQAVTKALQITLADIHKMGGGDAAVTPEDVANPPTTYDRSKRRMKKTTNKLTPEQQQQLLEKENDGTGTP
jgi:hypothetical protein